MYIPDNIQILRNKLFERQNNFKSFTEITTEDLEKIKNEAQEFISRFNQNESLIPYSKSALYEKVLSRITYYPHNQYYRDFDKQIIFVIYAMDPNLLMYKLYLATDIPKVQSKDPEIRTNERKKHNEAVSTYHNQLLKLIGITEQDLLKYEEILFNKFYKDKELVKGVNKNKIDNLMFYTPFLKSFNSITPERYQELKEIANQWLTDNQYDDHKTTTATAVYNILSQNKVLGLKSLAEQFCFFIMLIDPELDILKIYEEESRIPNITNRIKERFNFYYPDFIRIEKLYHQTFCPELEVNPWKK